MGGPPAAFRPNDPLDRGELADLVAGLTGKEAPARRPTPAPPVTIAQLDAQLVRGARAAAGRAPVLAPASARRGSIPTRYFGTEVVARLIGLRVNHPAAQDALELGPDDPPRAPRPPTRRRASSRFSGGEAELVDEARRDLPAPGR